MRKNDAEMSPGRIVGGKYLILRQIGSGGTGKVYCVKDLHLNKNWALKRIVSEENRKNASPRELACMTSLNHPRIPRIVDAFSDGQETCIVMDLLEGKTLDRILKEKERQIREDDCIRWGIQLCEILGYLHHLNPPLIYRDMKPGNILLRPDGTVMLLDFGASEQEGTVGYAAPEQVKGKCTDERSDIYGLGRTLYRLYEKRERIARKNKKFVNVLKRACEEKPERRFQSAEEMRKALEGCLLPRDIRDTVRIFDPVGVEKKIIGAAAVVLFTVCLAAGVSMTGDNPIAAAVPEDSESAVSPVEGNGRTKEQTGDKREKGMKKECSEGETSEEEFEEVGDAGEKKTEKKKEKRVGNIEKYEQMAEKCMPENPQQALYYLEEACRIAEQEGNREEVYKDMLEIFRILLRDSEGVKGLSDAEEKAEEYFQKLCAADPKEWEPYLLYVSYYYRKGKLDEAAKLFRKASDIEGAENDPNYQSLKIKLENAGAIVAD